MIISSRFINFVYVFELLALGFGREKGFEEEAQIMAQSELTDLLQFAMGNEEETKQDTHTVDQPHDDQTNIDDILNSAFLDFDIEDCKQNVNDDTNQMQELNEMAIEFENMSEVIYVYCGY